MARKPNRAVLEAEFMRICRMRGPSWIESVIRPLRLRGTTITVHDIPLHALSAMIELFDNVPEHAHGT